jgi:hypothetical protein
MQVIRAEGVILDRILESTYPVWHESLGRQAYRQFDAARMKTAWASRHQRRYALVEGTDLLASAIQSNLTAILDQRPMRVCGIGAGSPNPRTASAVMRGTGRVAARRSSAGRSGDSAPLFGNGLRTTAGHDRRGEILHGGDDGAHPRIHSAAAAAVWRRRAVLA